MTRSKRAFGTFEEHPLGSRSYRLRSRIGGRLVTLGSGVSQGIALAARDERVPNGRRVYFIRGPLLVKIGFSDDPKKRLAALTRERGEQLRLVAELPGGKQLEAFFHAAFREYHHQGEWFHGCGTLRALLRRLEKSP